MSIPHGGPLGNEPAHPFTEHNGDGSHYCDHAGLTKRELIAAMAMQGLITQSPVANSAAEFARQAVVSADALLAELAKEPQA